MREMWSRGTSRWCSDHFHSPPPYTAWETSCRGRSWGSGETLVGRGGWILGALLAIDPARLAIRACPQ